MSFLDKTSAPLFFEPGTRWPIFGLPIQNGERIEWIDEFIFGPETPNGYEGRDVFGSVDDFMRILQSTSGNDRKLLKSELVDEMFTPQLTGGAEEHYQNEIALHRNQEVFTSHKAGAKVNW